MRHAIHRTPCAWLSAITLAITDPALADLAPTENAAVAPSNARGAPTDPVDDSRVPAPQSDPALSVDDSRAPLTTRVLDALADGEVWVSGTEGYRLRRLTDTFGTVNDNDLRIFIDGGASAWDARLTLAGSFALFVDLDGRDRDLRLRSVHDPTGRIDLLVNDLSATYGDERFVPRFSVGRITVLEGFPLLLDGAAMNLVPLGHLARGRLWGLERSELFFSAGRTQHFYDVDPSLFEDWVAQGGIKLKILRGLSLEADYRLLVEDSAARGVDHDYGASARWRLGPWFLGRLYARGLNLGLQKIGGHGLIQLAPIGLDASVRVDAQTLTLGEVHERANPYYAILGTSRPNVRWNINVGERWRFAYLTAGARAGTAGRLRLDGPDDQYNRTWMRHWVAAELTDVLMRGLYLTTTLELSFAQKFTDDGLVALGGVIGYRRRRWSVEAGTDFQRYKYTYYEDVDEIADVRTVWAGMRVPIVGPLTFRVDYRVEIYDRIAHTFNVAIAENFDTFDLMRWGS